MNTIKLNTIGILSGGGNAGGGGGGTPINNQEKSVDITENGTTEVVADAGFTGLSKVVVNTNVASSGVGAVAASPKAVNFRDYDGTVLYAYTKEEFLALRDLPPLPTRERLICQEWNWDYADAVEYVREKGILEVGATYTIDNESARLYIALPKYSLSLPLRLKHTSSDGEILVDWGDGKSSKFPITTLNMTRTYSKEGSFVISLMIENGELTLGDPNGMSTFGSVGDATSTVYANSLKKVYLGENIVTLAYSFKYFTSLSSIAIPNSVTNIGNSAFSNCTSLSFVVISNSVTDIGYQAFRYCRGLKVCDFRDVINVPTLGGSNAFEGTPSDCKIVVPDDLYDTWIAATNWSSLASKIVKASEFNG